MWCDPARSPMWCLESGLPGRRAGEKSGEVDHVVRSGEVDHVVRNDATPHVVP